MAAPFGVRGADRNPRAETETRNRGGDPKPNTRARRWHQQAERPSRQMSHRMSHSREECGMIPVVEGESMSIETGPSTVRGHVCKFMTEPQRSRSTRAQVQTPPEPPTPDFNKTEQKPIKTLMRASHARCAFFCYFFAWFLIKKSHHHAHHRSSGKIDDTGIGELDVESHPLLRESGECG